MNARSLPPLEHEGDPSSLERHASGKTPRRPSGAKRVFSGLFAAARKEGDLIHLRVPGELTYRDLVTRAVTKCCKIAIERRKQATDAPIRADFSHELVSAVGEAFNNVILHAYDGDANQAVTLVLRYATHYVEVELQDSGKSFDPDAVPEPDLTELPEGGMGLFIMKAFVDEVRYDAGDPNVLVLRKYFDASPGD